jgi:anti-sigma B factor antagonist
MRSHAAGFVDELGFGRDRVKEVPAPVLAYRSSARHSDPSRGRNAMPLMEVPPGDPMPKPVTLLEISLSQMEDQTLVVLAGELDQSTAPTLRAELLAAIEDIRGEFVLDIEKVTFLDSTGLGLFVSAHKKIEALGSTLIIFAPNAMVRRTFEITGLTGVLTIRPDA